MTRRAGLRGRACRIKKNGKGHYMLMVFDAKPAFVSEMERQLRFEEDIVRFREGASLCGAGVGGPSES